MNQKDSTTEILKQINKTMKGHYGVVPFLMLYDVFSLSVVLEFIQTFWVPVHGFVFREFHNLISRTGFEYHSGD